MAFLRTLPVLAVPLASVLACTFNGGGLGQTGGDSSAGPESSSTGDAGTGGPTSQPPTTDAPTSVGPAGEMTASGSTGPVDPDTSASATTAVDPSATSDDPMTTTTGSPGTTIGDESSSGSTSTSCTEQEFYKDTDKDGFGDPKMSMTACEAPAGYVDNGDDCDDKAAEVNPGAVEVCDMADNDCDELVNEFDPVNNTECGTCKMYLYPANNRVYHFCSSEKKWADAKLRCEQRSGFLAKDIDVPHHDWLVDLLPLASGPWWIGASSPNGDSKFKWLDGTNVPVPDPRWSGVHPLVTGDDRIVLLSNGNVDIWAGHNGHWYDREDKDNQPFICESEYFP